VFPPAAVEINPRGRLLAAFERVQANYVDELDESELVAAAINGMIGMLDSQSTYLDWKEFRDMRGGHGLPPAGLGLEFIMDKGSVKVVTPIDESPAGKAGVRVNDVITHMDGVPLHGLKAYQVVEKMAGPVNTTVRLTIMRTGYDKSIELIAMRQITSMRSVRMRLEGEDIGYIRIAMFNAATIHTFETGIRELSNQIPPENVKGYVLDLRNTPSGPLDMAVSVADAFLEDGEIVSIRGRNPEHIERFKAQPGDSINGKPLIVLINGGTAGATEIVAGALQDHKRATVIGSRSFGRGLVQTILPLGPRGGALRLTTGRYFTPAGHPIDANGVQPDIEVLQDFPQNPEDDKALAMAFDSLRGVASDPAFPPHRQG
jgi:carboxyl-terminal processing protease